MNLLHEENKDHKASKRKKVDIDFQSERSNIKCFPSLKQRLCCPPPRNTSRQSFYSFPRTPLFPGYWPWSSTRSTFTENASSNSSKVSDCIVQTALLFWNDATWWKHLEWLCVISLCSLQLCLLQEVWRLLPHLEWKHQRPWTVANRPSSEIQMKINRRR